MCYKGKSDPRSMNRPPYRLPPNCRPWVLLVPLVLSAVGCTGIPDTYAPPVQRKPLTGVDPGSLRAFVRVNESGAEAHFLKDVNLFLEGGHFRWTQQQPTFQFQVPQRPGMKLKVDFALHSAVLEKTGPITITYLINGKQFDRVRYTKDGEQHYEKPVPPALLSAGAPTIVTLSLDKVLQTPDGNKLGLILTAAGFVE